MGFPAEMPFQLPDIKALGQGQTGQDEAEHLAAEVKAGHMVGNDRQLGRMFKVFFKAVAVGVENAVKAAVSLVAETHIGSA